METKLLTGNQAAVLGAIDAGAEIMFGYPITPATEILEGWIQSCTNQDKRQYLQTEDEIAAGFGVLGAIAGGAKAFTATAGPGTVLMQDPVSMAENQRLPFVGIVMQRGGPSTGTVNFSQQEVNLTAFGGNGDGLRVVYSASSVVEMYELTKKSFDTAWKYRFPTFLLGDGYLGKMTENVAIAKSIKSIAAEKILQEKSTPTYLRNCYSSEESFGALLKKNINDWKKSASKIAESESFKLNDAKEIIIAHGLVATACKEAILELREKYRRKIGLFRPITLNPFPTAQLEDYISAKTKIYIVESSLNQLSHIVKYELFEKSIKATEIVKPAEGFTPGEIINEIRSL